MCENGLSKKKKRKPILLTAFSFQSREREKKSFEHHSIVYASNRNNTHVYKEREREKKRFDTTANIISSSSRDTIQRHVGRST